MKRIPALDLARGFTVLMIAPIHTLMLFGNSSIRTTLIGQSLAFIAEWHGAQIFMTIMGISFAFSKNYSVETICKRSLILLLTAYALNLLKFVIPHFLGFMPVLLLQELQVDPGVHGYTQLLLLGDILHFAAFALIILFVISKSRHATIIALLAAIIVCFISPLFWDGTSDNPVIDYGLQLLGSQPPRVYFPLLPWLVYPLLGFWLGGEMQKEKNWLGLDSTWIFGAGLMIIAASIKFWISEAVMSTFYRTRPLDTILHAGFTFITLSAWHWISTHVKPNYLFMLFRYASRKITRIYIIQWPLICWLLPFFGYQQTGFAVTIWLIFLTSFITLSLSLFTDLIKSSKTGLPL